MILKTNKKLGDLCVIQSGGTPSRSNNLYWENGNIPWVKISDIQEKYITEIEENITQKGLENSSAKLFPKNTILFSIFASLGDVGILTKEATCNQAIAGLQIKDKNLSLDFLYYFLLSIKHYIAFIGRGVAQNNINLSILRNLSVPLPSLVEQKRIAERLDKVQELIALQKEQLTKLDDLIKSRFIDLFGDSISSPKKWPQKRMGELFKITSGGTPSRKNSKYFEGGTIPWVKTGDLTTPYLVHTDECITKLGMENSSAKLFPKGTVLLAMYGATIGAVSILGIEATTNQACAAFLPTTEVLPFYLYSFLHLRKKHLVSLGVGGAQPNISGEILKREKILCPPVKLQTQFADFVTKIEAQKGLLTTRLSHLETLYKSLMQEYFG